MKVTAITATCDRPDAFELCCRMLARQTQQVDQWIILDDGQRSVWQHAYEDYGLGAVYHFLPQFRGPRSMAQKVLWAVQHPDLITGDAILFIEDDDFYRADWVEWCVRELERGYDMVGEGCAAYYNVRRRWWSLCLNVRHAALCQTAITRDLLEPLANVIQAYDSPFFDGRLWAVDCAKNLVIPRKPEDRRVIGIKGIRATGGAAGYSGEHQSVLPPGARADPSLLELWRWAGNDAENYLSFYDRNPQLPSP